MPATIKISEQQIMTAAMDILRNKGIAALNVRSICRKLDCTARPIFRAFGSMAGLKKALIDSVKDIYVQRLNAPYESSYPFLSFGINYIRFALEDEHLFTFLFMSGQIDILSPTELISDQWIGLFGELSTKFNISKEEAKTLLLEMSILAHGMATLITKNNIRYQTHEIEQLFILAFEGIVLALKAKKEGGTIL